MLGPVWRRNIFCLRKHQRQKFQSLLFTSCGTVNSYRMSVNPFAVPLRSADLEFWPCVLRTRSISQTLGLCTPQLEPRWINDDVLDDPVLFHCRSFPSLFDSLHCIGQSHPCLTKTCQAFSSTKHHRFLPSIVVSSGIWHSILGSRSEGKHDVEMLLIRSLPKMKR
jgi:hypothetical protein